MNGLDPTPTSAPWPGTAAWLPSLDLHEADGDLVLSADPPPPGLDGSAAALDLGKLLRFLDLPLDADLSRTVAHLVHGVLEVRIPAPR